MRMITGAGRGSSVGWASTGSRAAFRLDPALEAAYLGHMQMVARCAAVIPCFNEGATVAAVVSAARKHLPFAVVVDDGSRDGTFASAHQAGATVARHERNRGKGAALQTGLELLRVQGYEWAVTLDGDGQHEPDDIPGFFQCAEQTGARLIIGDRMALARSMPWVRRQVNVWMSRQLSRRAGRQLPDTQCGFRLVHLPTWAELALRTQRFEVESEMLMAFLAARHPVAFVPVQVIRQPRRSRIRPLADSLRWWRWYQAGGAGRSSSGSGLR